MTRGALAGRTALLVLVASSCRDAAPERQSGADLADSVDAELDASAEALLPDVARLSGLEVRERVRLARESATQVRAYVATQLERDLPPAELAGMATSYALLGLMPDTLDLRSLLIELYTEQIVGYYDPDRRLLLVVEGVGRDEFRPILAHELVHALQDQHTNLDSLIARERGNDRQMAAQAALEGHAMLVMLALQAEERMGTAVDPLNLPNPGPELRAGLESQTAEFPVFGRAPRVIREALLFPYTAGAEFVRALWRHSGGRPPPLNGLLPQSTEQVLDPVGRFLTRRDEPVILRFDPSEEAGYENTLGRFETGLFLAEHLGAGADTLARGWGGDRYRLIRTEAGDALIWFSVWDDDRAARGFADAVRSIVGRGGIFGTVERPGRPSGSSVLVVIGETEAAVAAAPRLGAVVEREGSPRADAPS